ncbi:MAG: hypothetical protein PVF68_05420 [Acidobacteriota bacterium]|jgi:hypothetical protein
MPNLIYMLVNFVYLAGMAVWVGAALAGLVIFRGDLRHAPQAGRSLVALIHLQTLALIAAGVAATVKGVLWEGVSWPFLVRYFCLAAMGLSALYAVWSLAPGLRETSGARAITPAVPFLVTGLSLGLVALLFS